MSESINVCVRVRKLLSRENKDFTSPIWNVSPASNSLSLVKDKDKRWVFDRVWDPEWDNQRIYKDQIQRQIESVTAGFNATIFAYGQTASGKTHTMLGGDSDPGVINRAIDQIFDHIKQHSNEKQFLIRVAYMEIYNEALTDLLTEPSKRRKLNILEDTEGNTTIDNLSEVGISCPEDIRALMTIGEKHRHYGETNMNERSSRSHTIFRLIFESSYIEEVPEGADAVSEEGGAMEGGTCMTVSQLNLVDLAGSERASQTGAVGDRLREGANINKSLLILGQVISKLSEGTKDHIPIRGSKLTRILKNSLGGNAKTTIICTVTPAEFEQTKSTLEFASRAKKIVQHAEKNEILDDRAQFARMQKEILELKQALEKQAQSQSEIENNHRQEAEDEKISNLRKLHEQFMADRISSQATSTKESKKAEYKRRMSWHPSNIKRQSLAFPLKPFPLDDAVKRRLEQINKDFLEDDATASTSNKSTPSSVKDLKNPLNNDSFMGSDAMFLDEESSVSDSRLTAITQSSTLNGLDLSFELSPPKPVMINTKRRKNANVRFGGGSAFDTPSPSLRSSFAPSTGGRLMSPMVEALDLYGTPRNVLRQRLKSKDETLKKLSTDYKELEEFTKLEKEIHFEERMSLESEQIERLAKENEAMAKKSKFHESEYEKINEKLAKMQTELGFLQKENAEFHTEQYESGKVSRRAEELQTASTRAIDDAQEDARKVQEMRALLEGSDREVSQFKSLLLTLQDEIRDKVAAEDEAEKKITAATKENELGRNKLNELISGLKQAEEKAQAVTTQLAQAMEKISVQEQEIKRLSCAVESGQESLQAKEAEVQRLITEGAAGNADEEQALLEQRQQIVGLETKVQELQQAFQSEKQGLEEDITRLEEEKQIVQTEKEILEERAQDFESKLTAAVQEKEQEVSSLKETIEEINAKEKEIVQKLKKQISEKDDENKKLLGNVSQLESQLDSMKSSMDGKDNELLSELQFERELKGQLVGQVQELENNLENGSSIETSLKKEIEGLTGEKEELCAKMEDEKYSVDELKSELETLREANVASMSAQSEAAQAALGAANAKYSEQETYLKELEEALESRDGQITKLSDAQAVMKQELESIRGGTMAQEEQLNERLVAMQAELADTAEKTKKISEEKEEISVMLQEIRSQWMANETELEAAKEQTEKYIAQVEQLRSSSQEKEGTAMAQLTELQDQLKSLQEQVVDKQTLELELEAAKEETEKYMEKVEQLQMSSQEQEGSAQVQLRELQDKLKPLEQQVADKQALEIELESARDETEKYLAELEHLKLSSQKQEDSAMSQLSELQEQLQVLQEQVADKHELQRELETQSEAFERNQVEAQTMQQQITALQEQLNQKEMVTESLQKNSGAESERMAILQQQLADKQKQENHLSRQVHSLQEELESRDMAQLSVTRDLEEKLRSATGAMEAVKIKGDEFRSQSQALKQDLEVEKRFTTELETQVKDFVQERENGRARLQELEASLQAANAAREETKAEYEELGEIFDEYKADSDKNQIRLTAVEQALKEEKKRQADAAAVVVEQPAAVVSDRALRDKLQATHDELATLKTRIQRDEGQYKSKCGVLTQDLNCEREMVRGLKDKLRRLQAEKMDATIMPAPSRMRQNREQQQPEELNMGSRTPSVESLKEGRTSGSSSRPGNAASTDKERFEAAQVQFADSEWSVGCGVGKEMLLDLAKARIAALELEKTKLETQNDLLAQGEEHYKKKATEWKGEALKLKKKMTTSTTSVGDKENAATVGGTKQKSKADLASVEGAAAGLPKPNVPSDSVLKESKKQEKATPSTSKSHNIFNSIRRSAKKQQRTPLSTAMLGGTNSASYVSKDLAAAANENDEDEFKLNVYDDSKFRPKHSASRSKMPKTPKTPGKENCKQQ